MGSTCREMLLVACNIIYNLVQWNLDIMSCQGTGKIKGSLYQGSFPYITLLLG